MIKILILCFYIKSGIDFTFLFRSSNIANADRFCQIISTVFQKEWLEVTPTASKDDRVLEVLKFGLNWPILLNYLGFFSKPTLFDNALIIPAL